MLTLRNHINQEPNYQVILHMILRLQLKDNRQLIDDYLIHYRNATTHVAPWSNNRGITIFRKILVAPIRLVSRATKLANIIDLIEVFPLPLFPINNT